MIPVLPTAVEEIARTAMLTTFSEQAYVARALGGDDGRPGRSSGKPDLSTLLMTYATAMARGARAAIANARVVPRLARHHTRTNSTANGRSPASAHVAAACCTHAGVARARSVMSR
ncbi:hypothetical protein SCHAM137S_00029 [Streptomyces chartreusis]